MSREAVVLIIDDEEEFGKVVCDILEMKGYRTYMARHVLGAVALLESYQPELILLDVMMPEIDGLSLLRAIRNDQKLNDITVVVMSAKISDEDKSAAMDAGANAFLEKPLTMDELLAVVEEFLPIDEAVI